MADQPKVGEILLAAGVIDDFQLRAALGEQARWGRRLGVTLIKMGFVEERDLVRALAAQLSLPVASLEGKRIPQEVLDLVPQKIADRALVMPLFVKEEGGQRHLYLGMEDPSDLEVLDDLRFRTGMQIHPVMVGPSELCEAIDRYYHRGQGNSETTLELTGGEDELSQEEMPLVPLVSEADAAAATAAARETRWSLPEDAPAASPQSPQPESSEDTLLLEAAPAAEVRPPRREEAAGTPKPSSTPADASALVLQAITQLLIEKGLIHREELAARIRALQDARPKG